MISDEWKSVQADSNARKGATTVLAHECSHAEIGSQASLSRWCPMGVRVQVSLVALIYFHSSVGSERLPYKQGVIGSNPIGSTNLPPQWCNGSTRDCDSLSSGSNLGWRTKIKNSIKIVIVYPLFYDKVFALARRSPSIKSIMSRRTWDVGERDPCSVTG